MGNDMFGSQLIMTDDILDRIVYLAHFGKIDDLEALQSQVSWRYCDRWGLQILNLVKTHFPSIAHSSRESLQSVENLLGSSTGNRPPPSTGRARATASVTRAKSSTKSRARGPYRCGSCGSTTHIGKLSIWCIFCRSFMTELPSASNHICPNHKSHTGAQAGPSTGVQATFIANENVFLVRAYLHPQLPSYRHIYR
jgi:hypothetical protein